MIRLAATSRCAGQLASAPQWNGPYHVRKKNKDALNILLLPWPDEFHADSIEAVARTRRARMVFVTPRRTSGTGLNACLLPNSAHASESAIKGALEASGEIHAIVFPELSPTSLNSLRRNEVARRHGVMLIAGVHGCWRWRA